MLDDNLHNQKLKNSQKMEEENSEVLINSLSLNNWRRYDSKGIQIRDDRGDMKAAESCLGSGIYGMFMER